MNQQYSANVAELPPYRALLIVDVKDFSGREGRHHAEVTEAIPGILRQAFGRCGHADLWDEVRFQGTTGDGYFLGFGSAALPFLINPFLPALQEELSYRNTVRPVAGQDGPVRMRVSINVGPMTDSGAGRISDGSGDARIENHRLLDSDPVRDLLVRSSPATCVAAIISSRAYEDAVVAGFADDDPSLFVEAPVRVKRYQGTAYLRVPRPSGDLLANGFHLPVEDQDDAAGKPAQPQQDARPIETTNTMRDVHGKAIQARNYHVDKRRGGVDNSGNSGTIVMGVRGPVNTGSGNLHHEDSGTPRRRWGGRDGR